MSERSFLASPSVIVGATDLNALDEHRGGAFVPPTSPLSLSGAGAVPLELSHRSHGSHGSHHSHASHHSSHR